MAIFLSARNATCFVRCVTKILIFMTSSPKFDLIHRDKDMMTEYAFDLIKSGFGHFLYIPKIKYSNFVSLYLSSC